MTRFANRLLVACAVALSAAACGSGGSTTSPSGAATPAISVTATPSAIAGAPCTGCGVASTDREALTTLTIRDTAGVAVSVVAIEMTLREQGSGATIAAGQFESGAVVQLAGSSRVPAGGSLAVRCGVHYAADLAGRSAALTYVVRVTDDRGNQATQSLTVNVTT